MSNMTKKQQQQVKREIDELRDKRWVLLMKLIEHERIIKETQEEIEIVSLMESQLEDIIRPPRCEGWDRLIWMCEREIDGDLGKVSL